MEFFFYFHFFTESVCFFNRHYAKLKKYENSNLQTSRKNNKQSQQPHDEAEEQYLYRLEVHQQNFGGDKGRSPNDDGEQGGEMSRRVFTLHAAFPPYL